MLDLTNHWSHSAGVFLCSSKGISIHPGTGEESSMVILPAINWGGGFLNKELCFACPGAAAKQCQSFEVIYLPLQQPSLEVVGHPAEQVRPKLDTR